MFDCDDNHQYTTCVHTSTHCVNDSGGEHTQPSGSEVWGWGWSLDTIGQNPGWFDLEERVDVAFDLQETEVSQFLLRPDNSGSMNTDSIGKVGVA